MKIKLTVKTFTILMLLLVVDYHLVYAGTAPQLKEVQPLLRASPKKIAYMPCEARGDPEPSITWEKEGKPVHTFGSRFSINKDSKALRIFNLQTNDTGNYTCIAKNRYGYDSVTVTLLVLVGPKAMVIAPTNFTFMEQTNQELVCRSQGLPRPIFEWLTNRHKWIKATPSVQIDESTPLEQRMYTRERQIDEELYESVLVIQPLTYEDLGNFACVASNEVGSDRDTVTLDVRFPPKILSQHSPPREVQWWEGHNANLTCTVAGNEAPEITWYLDGRPFDCMDSSSVFRAEVTSTCLVTSVRHGGPGNYTCAARNSLGNIRVHDFHVKQIHPPPAVVFTPISVHRYEVDLSVKVPSREATPPATYVLATYKLASYTVEDAVGKEYEYMEDLDERGEATVKLRGVLNDREYVITMRARNVAGFGPSTSMVVSTAIPAPTTTTSLPPRTVTTTPSAFGDDSNNRKNKQTSYSNENKDNTLNDIDEDDNEIVKNDDHHQSKEGENNVESEEEVDDGRDLEMATAYKVLGRDNGGSSVHGSFVIFSSFCLTLYCCLCRCFIS